MNENQECAFPRKETVVVFLWSEMLLNLQRNFALYTKKTFLEQAPLCVNNHQYKVEK